MKGWQNQYDYGERIYDPRIGRWLSVDALKQKFQNLTPYNSMNNNPILFIDPDGRTIIIDARSLEALLQTLNHLAVIQMTNQGSKAIQKLHETSALYKVKAYGIEISEYTGSDNTIRYNPFSSITYDKGYKEHPLLSLGHELDHAENDYRGSKWSTGVLEASAVNSENYYRSVIFGEKAYEREYDWGWGWGDADKYDDEFKWNLSQEPNPNGERVFSGRQEIRGNIKVDSKNTYVIETVGTFAADSDKVKEFKNGIVNYFWYKKDKDSEWEHKAVLIKVINANEEKKD